MTGRSGTLVDEVADRIALAIASGRLRAGERLPSIRRLADEHGINPSTVQQVLGRLTAAGFVEPRHGVGVVVRDVRLYGGIETWRYLFRFSHRLPDMTVRHVQEVLETLRLFYESALTRIAANPADFDPAPVRRAVQQLELLAGTTPVRAAEVHESVLHVLRTFNAALGGGIMLGVLNSLGGMLGDVPEVVGALYSDPTEHAWFWNQALTACESGDLASGRQTLALLDDWHAVALDRLRTRLTP